MGSGQIIFVYSPEKQVFSEGKIIFTIAGFEVNLPLQNTKSINHYRYHNIAWEEHLNFVKHAN